MKTLVQNITRTKAENIKVENSEYLLWTDGTEITTDEIIASFMVTNKNGIIILEHKSKDFRIEDIIY